MKFKPVKGKPPEVCWQPCDALNVDPAYQRTAEGASSQKLIGRIAEHWDWRLCAPLTVSHRKDTETGEMAYFVIDGQHRLRAAEMRDDIPELPCIISTFSTFEEEALAFVAINAERRAVTPLDRFHAKLAAKDPLAVKIAKLVTGAGLTVTRANDVAQWAPKEIAFPDTIGRVLSTDEDAAGRALAVLGAAYPDAPLTRGKELFGGLWVIFHERRDMARQINLISDHMATKTQREWVQSLNFEIGENETIGRDRAMSRVILRNLPIEPRKPTPAPAPARAIPPPKVVPGKVTASPSMKLAGFKPGEDGKAWCGQCEQRKTLTAATLCTSQFCKLK